MVYFIFSNVTGIDTMSTETKKRGRPTTGRAMTAAEKQAAYRSRQKSLINQTLINPPIDQELIKKNKELMELAYPQGIYHEWLTNKAIAEMEVRTNQNLRKEIDQLHKEMAKLRAENNKLKSKK